jgi:hypothetical protein
MLIFKFIDIIPPISNAAGDGIDSNGCLSISGGTVFVSGPVDSGNAWVYRVVRVDSV